MTDSKENYPFSSVILRFWVLIWSGIEPSPYRTAVPRSLNWADQVGAVIYQKLRIHLLKRNFCMAFTTAKYFGI